MTGRETRRVLGRTAVTLAVNVALCFGVGWLLSTFLTGWALTVSRIAAAFVVSIAVALIARPWIWARPTAVWTEDQLP